MKKLKLDDLKKFESDSVNTNGGINRDQCVQNCVDYWGDNTVGGTMCTMGCIMWF